MKTITKFSTAVFLLASSLIFNLSAQVKENSLFDVSFSPEVGLPIGDLSDRYNWSLGGSVEVEYSANNRFRLTFNTGYFNLFANNSGYALDDKRYGKDLNILPVAFGLKYFLAGPLFIQGEAGASFLLNKADGGYDRTPVFTYSPQIGYRFDLGNEQFMYVGIKWIGSAKYTDNGTANHILGLRVAYGAGVGFY